jgi:hypothetical protein
MLHSLPSNASGAMSLYESAIQDCKDMDDAPFVDTWPQEGHPSSWTATPQEDNDCLTFKRMLPRLGPKPPPPGT